MWQDLSGPMGVTASALVGAVEGVHLAGFYPARARPRALAGTVGHLLISGLALTLAALLASAVRRAVLSPAWPASVVGAGLALLAGPLLFQALPRRARDSRAAILAMAAVNILLIVLLSGE